MEQVPLRLPVLGAGNKDIVMRLLSACWTIATIFLTELNNHVLSLMNRNVLYCARPSNLEFEHLPLATHRPVPHAQSVYKSRGECSQHFSSLGAYSYLRHTDRSHLDKPSASPKS